MASTLTTGTLTVTHKESIFLNGENQGITNTISIPDIAEVSRRIIDIPTSEVTLLSFTPGDAFAGTFNELAVRYIRITNLDDENFVYLVFKNEFNNEFCIKLDYGQSFIYNGDHVTGVVSTMLANQVALGFTEATGDVTDDSYIISNITATNKIIPSLRFNHDGATVEEGTVVFKTGFETDADGYRTTSHQLILVGDAGGVASYSRPEGSDTDGTSTYSAGFGDLVEITAEADTGTVDLEVFVANT